MKFLVDAQLPRRLARWLAQSGHDALHTLDLPHGNRTTDQQVVQVAESTQRIVVTKDDDFVQSHLVIGAPSRLLLVATGNIGNAELETLLHHHWPEVVAALETHRFVEINRQGLVIHH